MKPSVRVARALLLILAFVGVCALVRWSRTFLAETLDLPYGYDVLGALIVCLALLGAWLWAACSVEPQRPSSHFDGIGAEDDRKD